MSEKRDNKKIWLYISLVVVLIILIGGGYFLYNYFEGKNSEPVNYNRGSNQNTPQTPFVYTEATEEDFFNFEKIISKNEMINELPNDAKILLSFYTFEGNKRVWQNSYILTKGSVKKGETSDYDIKLILHSKYITVLDENNLCRVIKTAKNNNDFGSQTTLSTFKLAWKYKGILEYKDCLGL